MPEFMRNREPVSTHRREMGRKYRECTLLPDLERLLRLGVRNFASEAAQQRVQVRASFMVDIVMPPDLLRRSPKSTYLLGLLASC